MLAGKPFINSPLDVSLCAEPLQGTDLGLVYLLKGELQTLLRARPSCPGLMCLVSVERYRALGVATTLPTDEGEKRQQRVARKFTKMQFKTQLQANVTRDLPRNVPY
jgi:hypothetical protein